MKTYIKPRIKVIEVEAESLLDANSITTVSGVDGITTSDTEFTGGNADARRGSSLWDEE